MAIPTSRTTFKDYCKRKLGYPVLEINVDDDQIDDLIDDALQIFYERHFDGVERMYLKHKLTQDEIDRGSASGTEGVGIVTTTVTSTTNEVIGTNTTNWVETSNYLEVPDSVIAVSYTHLTLPTNREV